MKNKLPTDLYYLAGSFITLLVILRIVFINEDLFAILKFSSSFFWIFVIPAFIMTYLYKINFIERFAISVVLSAALMGIGMYYLGLMGVNIKYSVMLLPIVYSSFSALVMVLYRVKTAPKKVMGLSVPAPNQQRSLA